MGLEVVTYYFLVCRNFRRNHFEKSNTASPTILEDNRLRIGHILDPGKTGSYLGVVDANLDEAGVV